MKRPRWTGDWPIPKSINLPGVRIRVKLLNTAEMETFGTLYGAWIYDVEKDKAVIIVNEDLPIEVQRYTIQHELVHAINDLMDQSIEKFPEYVQTESMAKMLAFLSGEALVDGEEYGRGPVEPPASGPQAPDDSSSTDGSGSDRAAA